MNSWREHTLKEVCIVDWGNTKLTKASFVEGGKYLAVSAAGCDGRIGHKEHSRHTPVLSAIGAQCGRMFLPEEDFTAIKNTITLTPRVGVCSGKFLYHLLTHIELPKRGAAQPFISKGDIQSFRVPVPPLPEQERIVAILDEAFEGIATATAHAERNLHNARELFQSVLQSTFQQKGEDWVETTLDTLCSIKHGFAFKGEFFVSEGDFVCLTPGNFYEEGGYRDRGPKTKFYNGEIPKDFVLSKGDFLIAMTEQAVGLLGSSIIVPESNRFLHNQRLGLVQLKDGVDWENGFFFHQFNTPRFRDAVQATASGAKVRHTSPKKLGAIPVVVPPLKTQRAIVQKLDALATETRRLEAIYQRKLAALAELKQSLLQRAFAGEL